MGRSSSSGYRREVTIALLVVVVMVFGMLQVEVEGRRMLQNYYGSFGGTGGLIPTPLGPVFVLGPSTYCSVPGTGCVTVPGSGSVGSGVGSVQPGGGGGSVGSGVGSVQPGGGSGGSVGAGVGSPP